MPHRTNEGLEQHTGNAWRKKMILSLAAAGAVYTAPILTPLNEAHAEPLADIDRITATAAYNTAGTGYGEYGNSSRDSRDSRSSKNSRNSRHSRY